MASWIRPNLQQSNSRYSNKFHNFEYSKIRYYFYMNFLF
ncbi:hypothetical protein LEP1GSC049_3458 [Leptospira kirschneri serovar Cynopteri str. 3522 CT]|nr:hypothetical protein LEP1GSC044_3695 [Leptospira kirschneri serovar Grippotyphosa str. RM52]EPG50485.1 hypothetical protein LEP1GSC049_3458 [Leptospira kirschneri serovar Cynopteri str. 3522 CT]